MMDNCIIILVVIIVISSYLFKLKEFNDANTHQLLYIVAGIFLVVTLQYLYGRKNDDKYVEKFADGNDNKPPEHDWDTVDHVTHKNFEGIKNILNYLKNVQETDLDKEETQKILDELRQKFDKFKPAELDHQISQITSLLENLQNVSSLTQTPNAKETTEDNILENRSIKESQFLQDVEIKNLEKELQELQKLYTEHLENEAKKTYKKIPVYTSCVMEANGTTTTCPNKGGIAFTDAQPGQSANSNDDGSDQTSQAINKLIKSISKGGISVSLASK